MPHDPLFARPAIPPGLLRRSLFGAGLGLLLALLGGCAQTEPYRKQLPVDPQRPSVCQPPGTVSQGSDAAPCVAQSTEVQRDHLYTLHVIEFDDEGWPRDNLTGGSQIDSAIGQIQRQLVDTAGANCVRLFVYVHGWRHNASTDDEDLMAFRGFLAQASQQAKAVASEGRDGCDRATLPASLSRPSPNPNLTDKRTSSDPNRIKTVGIYVGWRGLSLANVWPFVYLSFWDRKHTAERVAQGSVRELFGRLNSLSSFAAATGKTKSGSDATLAQLRTYVIAHSFGASVVFRALSQSLIDSFAEDLDVQDEGDRSARGADVLVSRFVDMVVLVNPAIEAARFDPLFRAAVKRRRLCERSGSPRATCDSPEYQAPILAIFTSEADKATHYAFPVGAGLSNLFEAPVDEAQRRAIHATIGWDENYRTHGLSLATGCDATDAYPYMAGTAGLLYRTRGWRWCFDANGARMALSHLEKALLPEGPEPYNGPLWNVQVSGKIVSDHGDIWNPNFRGLLLHLFTEQRLNPALPQPMPAPPP